MKRFLAILLLLVQCYAMVNSFANQDDDKSPSLDNSTDEKSDTTIETHTAVYQSVKRKRLLDGIIEPVNQSTVSAQTQGVVKEINFDIDDFVPADTTLIRLSDTEQRAELERTQSIAKRMKSELGQTRKQYQRIENLAKSGTASQANYDSAKRDVDSATAAHTEAEASVVRSKKQLEYTQIKAPFSGVVTARHVELGESVRPGTPLMSGFSLQKLRATVDVPTRLINKIKKYRVATVILPDGRKLQTKKENLVFFPFARRSSNTITVRIQLPTDIVDVYPGMLVKVSFEMGEQIRLSVPQSAVFYRSEVVGVYTVDQLGKVSLRHIRVGNELDDDMIEVLAGLEEGEEVAIDPVIATRALSKQRLMAR